ncbi:MAG: DNA alkylation repair protein [Balneolaceae bacterium]
MAFKQLKLWFDKDLAELLADKIQASQFGFDKSSFVERVDSGVSSLELKDRVELIADELHRSLGDDYEENASLLKSILGPENEEETGMFKEFYWIMPIAKYVEKYGLDNFEVSMDMILEITKRNTSEYTIRPFLEKYTRQTLTYMVEWSKNENKHARRLASEGGRPRLPWAAKLQIFIDDPSPLFPILENLKDDSSKYVQKSVANCLNDILKDNPEIAKSVIQDWSKSPTKERKWIIKHALRNLLKKGDEWATNLVMN